MSATATPERAPSGAVSAFRGVRWSRWAPWIVLSAVMAAGFAVVMHGGRETTFYLDDWPHMFGRQDWTVFNLLKPHIDHLQVFPAIVQKLMYETIGLHHYWPYRLVLALLNVLCGVLLFIYGRKRIGPWPSIALAACLTLMATSWFNLMFAFQMNFVGGVAAGLGALILLERRTRRGDILACVLLVISIGCNGVALPFVGAVTIELLLRRDWKRLYVPAIPLFLFGLWRLEFSDNTPSRPSLLNLQEVPRWILDGIDDSAASIFGTSPEFGPVLAVGLVAFVVYALSKPGRFDPRFAAILSLPIIFWTLTGIGRVNEITTQPDENRFLYPAGLMLALVLVEAARHVPLNKQVTIAVTALLAFGAVKNANEVELGGNDFRSKSQPGKDGATALDIAGQFVPANFANADPNQGTYLLEAGPYLQTVKHYGSSPGYTREELLAERDDRKMGVDQALVRVHRMGVVPVAKATRPAAVAPRVLGTANGDAVPSSRGCVRFTPNKPAEPSVTVEMPWTGVLVRSGPGPKPAEVRVRRYSTMTPPGPLGTVAANTVARVKPWARDKMPEPFAANVRSTVPVEVCAAR